jgi:Protein kinase domain/Domain of unknown function (DUF4384)
MPKLLMPEKLGKYRIIEQIGRGGMGMIFKAHDPVLDRLVALKVIATDAAITGELRARFFREAKACAQLNHPNIVTVLAMGDDDGQLFIVMELLDGEELGHLIAERRVLALEDQLSIMIQASDGLLHAHQKGVVHRDIKPSNIFVLRNGQVKILDFGLAQVANADGLTGAGLIIGNLRYISPEQACGRVDHRSDIYSLGAVFYELLAMRPALTEKDSLRLLAQLRTHEPPALDELSPTIPPALAAVVRRAMHKDPAQRFADLGQMRSELQELLRPLTEQAKRPQLRVCDQHGQVLELRAAFAGQTDTSGQDEAAPATNERVPLATVERDTTKLESVKGRGDYVQRAFGRACVNFNAVWHLYLRAEGVVRQAWRRPVGKEAIRRRARARDSSIALPEGRILGIHSTERIETPTVLMESSGDLDGAPAAVAFQPVASVVKRPSYWWTLPNNRRARDATGADAVEVVPAARRDLRRVAMAVFGGLAMATAGMLLLWLPSGPPTDSTLRHSTRPAENPLWTIEAEGMVPEVPEVAPSAASRPDAPPSHDLERTGHRPAQPPSPRTDTPLTPRQALEQVFEGRNRAHFVTATVLADTVRMGRGNVRFSITSSRPGYVYLMALRSDQPDVELFVPKTVEDNNHVEPGRPLTLPGPPRNARGQHGIEEFLAIVSDEPRDFSALRSASGNVSTSFRLEHLRLDQEPAGSTALLVGTVACASATPCSASYGAVTFSMDSVRWLAKARGTPRPPAAAVPHSHARLQMSRRCSDILERASLGEPFADDEQTILRQECQ